MGYPERNRIIIGEIKARIASGEPVLSKSGKVGRNKTETTLFVPVGSLQSAIAGELYVGVKEYTPAAADYRFALDLAIINAIASSTPYSEELPAFYALLKSMTGERLGFLMEDFSKGGHNVVMSIPRGTDRESGLLPVALLDLNPNLTDEELVDSALLVGKEQRRRLVDFNNLGRDMSITQLRERFSTDEIRNRLEEFTVFVPGDSIQ